MPDPRRTAESLLAAGAELADTHGLVALTVDAVVERAGTGKGTFYRHFGSQEGYLVAIHRRFAAELGGAALRAGGSLSPGAKRLSRIIGGYLDACLGRPGVKAFLTEARNIEAVDESARDVLGEFSAQIEADCRAIGWDEPAAAARLLVAMAHEIALAERRAGRADPALRGTLAGMAARQAPVA